MEWSSVMAGLILFWPAVLVLFLLGFGFVVFAIVLVSSAATLFGIFLYGVYCILRDTGLLESLFTKLGNLTKYLGLHVQRNVRESFVFDEKAKIPEGPALFVCHPHGLYGLTWFIHFASGLSEWPGSKRPVLAVHSVFFSIPILRELFLSHNCIEASEHAIKKTLAKGESVALLVGGIEELLLTQADSLKLVLQKREGFVRIAKEMNIPLVPLVSPNENNLFTLLENSWIQWFQTVLYKKFHLAVIFPSFQNLRSWFNLSVQPFSKPVVTYVLKPVVPDGKSLKDIKSEYIERLNDFSKESGILIQLVH
jgi:hypothetical protein